MHQQFMAEIIANPDDDGPRLVYADWLEEQGDPRADFIRLQCRIYQMTEEDAEFSKLDKLQMRIIKKNRTAWLKDIRPVSRGKFYRGFVEEIRFGVQQFAKFSEQIYARQPIRLAAITAVSTKNIDLLADARVLPKVRELSISASNMSPDAWTKFSNSNLTQLRKLRLSGEQINGSSVQAICDGKIRETLEELNFGNLFRTADCAVGLRESVGLNGLKKLSIEYSAMGCEGVVLLAISPHLSSLESLELEHCTMPQEGFFAVAESQVFENLKELKIVNSIKEAVDRSFEDCHLFPNIENLNLSNNGLGNPFVLSAFKNLKWPKLKRLDLSQTFLSTVSAEAIANSPQMGQLISLKLNNNFIADDGAIAIINSGRTENLRVLNLGSCRLTENVADAILESDGLDQLAKLDLSGNNVPTDLQKALRKKYGQGVCTFSRV